MGRLLYLACIAGLIALLLRIFVVEGIVIASASMDPTLPVGRHVFVNKLSYAFGKPQRGDVVMFPSPVDVEKGLVKRVIAIEGDSIEIHNKDVLVNGVLLREPYVVHTRPDERLKGDELGPIPVPPGAVFVMGDNRDESGDNRDWVNPVTKDPIHFISVKNIRGKVLGNY
ncbi:MAG TPA: signal peptidase I [Elusimicrobiota bacterium]|nr:signal peptidase I [Elusimicrobiota bacterium]